MNNDTPVNNSTPDIPFYTGVKKIQLPDGSIAKKISDLAMRLQQGDDLAWDELYLFLSDPLSSFLIRLLHSEEDAWDIVQEVFAALWTDRDKLSDVNNLPGYIYKLSKNYAYKILRRKGIEGKYAKSLNFDDDMVDFDAEDIVIGKEAEVLVRIALGTMPEQRRRVFEMSRFEGKSNDDIARILNMSKRTVESHLYRVLKELKELIGLFFILLFSGKF